MESMFLITCFYICHPILTNPALSTSTLLALPLSAASLAYFNAKLSLPNDWRLISNLVRAKITWTRRIKKSQINAFYPLEHNASNPRIADGIFMIYEGRQWTFRQAYDLSLRYAGWLHKSLHIKPGEIVALDFMNSPEFIFLTLGLWSLGAIPAYINYNLTGAALVHCVKISTARILLLDPNVAHNVTEEVRNQFASEGFREDNSPPLEVVMLDAPFVTSLPYFPPYRAPDSDRVTTARSPGALIFTSGTTGLPKAAIMPWDRFGLGTFLAGWQGLRPVYSKRPDRFYTCMPLYHSSALMCCFNPCLVSGATMVLGHKFSKSKFWSEVRTSRATIVQYVGETLRYLLANPPSEDDRDNDVRMAFGNGLRPDVWERFKERFGVDTIAEFYSATEGTSGSWNYSSNDFASGAIGRNGGIMELMLRKELAVVKVDWEKEEPWRDPTTGLCVQVPRGQVGELLYAVDAKNVEEKFAGYFRNASANEKKILRDVLKKGDAWFRTGDVVSWDKEGRWWFSDRIGDTYRWKSENVSTSEVAEVLGRHPLVVEANVYGVEIPGHDGRAGCAAILLGGGHGQTQPDKETLDSIASHASRNLPRYAVPVFLRVVTEIMATGNNKQQKHVLRAEGVDPSKVKKEGDALYWLKGGTYVPFRQREWMEIQGGVVKL